MVDQCFTIYAVKAVVVDHHAWDPFAYEKFYAMRYINWMGSLWKIVSVEVKRPRLILKIGGVYHGEQAQSTDDS